ncbi:Predicted esterase [Williamsia sterculiae]|uniref:Predicted esterase n=2 Tax=Williamsia sterculiae TaxID=1344003 RepID=A0A1N7GV74_9NOCA|nr:Predicted esterase [Williamsia sterculiae]
MVTPSPSHPPILRAGSPPADPVFTVLVLHGGKVRSVAPTRSWQLSVLRMWPFTRALRRTFPQAAVYSLQYRLRGWNGADRSPVRDARWALEQIRERHGDIPVVLVGHSMGGRTAAAVADEPSVVGVMALAPWWPEGTETVTLRPGQRLRVAHGTADSWTDPKLSRRATDLAGHRGVDAEWIPMARAGHFMLMRPRRWTRQVLGFVAETVADHTPNAAEEFAAEGFAAEGFAAEGFAAEGFAAEELR